METGTQRIQMYTASASKYTVYKMYTRGGGYMRGVRYVHLGKDGMGGTGFKEYKEGKWEEENVENVK